MPASSAHQNVTHIVPSEEFVGYLHPSFLSLDYNNKKVHISILVISSLAFFLLFLVTHLLFVQSKMYVSHSRKYQVFLSQTVYRGVFGATCILTGSHSLLVFTNFDRDVVFGTTASSYMTLNYASGFFLFDSIAVIFCDLKFKTSSRLLMAHHLMAFISVYCALSSGVGHSFACRLLVLEMITPFSGIAFVLQKAGKHGSLAWRLSHFLCIHTFHLRNVVECYLWYISFLNRERIWLEMPASEFICLYISLIIFTFVMTPSWGYKKTLELCKIVSMRREELNGLTHNGNGHLKKSE